MSDVVYKTKADRIHFLCKIKKKEREENILAIFDTSIWSRLQSV